MNKLTVIYSDQTLWPEGNAPEDVDVDASISNYALLLCDELSKLVCFDGWQIECIYGTLGSDRIELSATTTWKFPTLSGDEYSDVECIIGEVQLMDWQVKKG